jgi:hypothetical protein
LDSENTYNKIYSDPAILLGGHLTFGADLAEDIGMPVEDQLLKAAFRDRHRQIALRPHSLCRFLSALSLSNAEPGTLTI